MDDKAAQFWMQFVAQPANARARGYQSQRSCNAQLEFVGGGRIAFEQIDEGILKVA